MVVNRACEIISAWATAGNISGVSVLHSLFEMHSVQGKQLLSNQHCKMETHSRTNSLQADLSEEEEHYMRQRNLIEMVNSQLKDQLGLEHSRHRSWRSYIVHIYTSLIAYQCVTIKAQVKPFVRA